MLSLLVPFSSLPAQVVAPNDPKAVSKGDTKEAEDEAVVLSPFIVSAEEDAGYTARATLAGTRLRTDLRDVGSAVTVVTSKFLSDTQARSNEDLLVYTPSTEVGGQGGNFLGGGDAAVPNVIGRTGVSATTRVRGLAEADSLRDFFLSRVPWDSYNTGRVDIQRGPNSVLFGIGSPAGVINASLNKASLRDSNSVSNSLDDQGTVRFAADFNKVLARDELAVRLNLLHEDKKFKQRPAYRDDHRAYGAVTWAPRFLKTNGMSTTVNANAEFGRIKSNNPLMTPPIDLITPWFNDMNQATFTARNSNDLSQVGTAAFNPWISRSPYQYNGGVVAVFADPNSPFQSGLKVTNVSNLGSQASVPARQNKENVNLGGIASYNEWAFRTQQPGYQIQPYKARSLRDPAIFDYYNNLLVGPMKGEWMDFDTVNVTAAQTFFNGKAGVEVAYDRQNVEEGNFRWQDDTTYAISVDPFTTLPSGAPNPNVGRAFVAGSGLNSGSVNNDERETLRFTAFGELEARRFLGDTTLSRILGRHIFTGSHTTYETRLESRSWRNGWIGAEYPKVLSSHAVDNDNRRILTQHYVSGDLRGSSLDNLGINRIRAFQVPVSDVTANWNTDLMPSAGFANYNVPVIRPGDIDDPWQRPFTGANKRLDEIDSQVLVWQGYLFGGNIVPMYGWRKDKATSYSAAGAPSDSHGLLQVSDPRWRLPSGPDDLVSGYGATRAYNQVSGETRTLSVVAHVPKDWTRRLPGGLSFSAFYNRSENFRPESGRRDVVGNYLPSPVGKTKDYGITIAALDDKVTLKVNRYETTVTNASLGSSIPVWRIQYEAWNQRQAWANHVGRSHPRHSWLDGTPGLGVTSANSKYGAGNELLWQPLPSERNDPTLPWQQTGYTQAAIDYWYDLQRDATDSWLANPIPKGMQEAWGMVGYDQPTYNGQINSSSLNSIVVNGDTLSKGLEFEFSANPVPGLNLTASAVKTDASRLSIGESWREWVEFRYNQLKTLPLGHMRTWGGQDWNVTNNLDTAVKNYETGLLPDYNLARALIGTSVPELRPWRFNVAGDYAFQSGALKGLNIGGAYRWQDKQVVGFHLNSTLNGYDVNRRYYGPTAEAVDVWAGYRRKLSERITWRMQLNVRNAFASKALIPVTVQPDGSPATLRIPEPRVLMLTNTFEF